MAKEKTEEQIKKEEANKAEQKVVGEIFGDLSQRLSSRGNDQHQFGAFLSRSFDENSLRQVLKNTAKFSEMFGENRAGGSGLDLVEFYLVLQRLSRDYSNSPDHQAHSKFLNTAIKQLESDDNFYRQYRKLSESKDNAYEINAFKTVQDIIKSRVSVERGYGRDSVDDLSKMSRGYKKGVFDDLRDFHFLDAAKKASGIGDYSIDVGSPTYKMFSDIAKNIRNGVMDFTPQSVQEEINRRSLKASIESDPYAAVVDSGLMMIQLREDIDASRQYLLDEDALGHDTYLELLEELKGKEKMMEHLKTLNKNSLRSALGGYFKSNSFVVNDVLNNASFQDVIDNLVEKKVLDDYLENHRGMLIQYYQEIERSKGVSPDLDEIEKNIDAMSCQDLADKLIELGYIKKKEHSQKLKEEAVALKSSILDGSEYGKNIVDEFLATDDGKKLKAEAKKREIERLNKEIRERDIYLKEIAKRGFSKEENGLEVIVGKPTASSIWLNPDIESQNVLLKELADVRDKYFIGIPIGRNFLDNNNNSVMTRRFGNYRIPVNDNNPAARLEALMVATSSILKDPKQKGVVRVNFGHKEKPEMIRMMMKQTTEQVYKELAINRFGSLENINEEQHQEIIKATLKAVKYTGSSLPKGFDLKSAIENDIPSAHVVSNTVVGVTERTKYQTQAESMDAKYDSVIERLSSDGKSKVTLGKEISGMFLSGEVAPEKIKLGIKAIREAFGDSEDRVDVIKAAERLYKETFGSGKDDRGFVERKVGEFIVDAYFSNENVIAAMRRNPEDFINKISIKYNNNNVLNSVIDSVEAKYGGLSGFEKLSAYLSTVKAERGRGEPEPDQNPIAKARNKNGNGLSSKPS